MGSPPSWWIVSSSFLLIINYSRNTVAVPVWSVLCHENVWFFFLWYLRKSFEERQSASTVNSMGNSEMYRIWRPMKVSKRKNCRLFKVCCNPMNMYSQMLWLVILWMITYFMYIAKDLSPLAIWMPQNASAVGSVFDWLQSAADMRSGKNGESGVIQHSIFPMWRYAAWYERCLWS